MLHQPDKFIIQLSNKNVTPQSKEACQPSSLGWK